MATVTEENKSSNESTPNRKPLTGAAAAAAARAQAKRAQDTEGTGEASDTPSSPTPAPEEAPTKPRRGGPRGPRTTPPLLWTRERKATLVRLVKEHDGDLTRVLPQLLTDPAFAGDPAAVSRLQKEDGRQLLRNQFNDLRRLAIEETRQNEGEDEADALEISLPRLKSMRGKKIGNVRDLFEV